MLGSRSPDIPALRSLFTTSRLTTVTGPPRAGKTALAAAAAARASGSFRDGMRLVPLGEQPDEALLAHAVLRTLGLPDRLSLPQAQSLCDSLSDSRSLLVLDGCEHVLRGCAALVRRLLANCPLLHIGVTSREPLGLAGERVFTVAPDAPPAERPGGATPANQALAWNDPVIGRSHQACTPPERLLWARLSVFGAEFELDDALQVCADRHLPAADAAGAVRGLARRSLLVACPGTSLYRMPEAIRDYGMAMLRELGEEDGARRRYQAWREVRS